MFVIQVEGMHCQHCVASIEAALKKLGDAKTIDVSLEEHAVRYEGVATKEQVEDAIEAQGFDVIK